MSLDTREVPVELTDEELKLRADQLARQVDEIKKLKLDLKNQSAALKAKIKEAEEELFDLTRIVRDRKEPRLVDCRWEPDYERGVMELVRCDNGGVVQVRGMEEHERQRNLFPLKDQAPAPAPGSEDADGEADADDDEDEATSTG